MAKAFETTFRAVNIALVNEMALLCDRMDINVWQVMDAAATKPFGIMRFDPGPGVGGHCVPFDPFCLAWKAREYNFNMRFVELAGAINASMPHFVRDKVIRALNSHDRPLKGARILMLGVAYKRDIADWRETPALKVLQLLEQHGALVDYHDPHIPSFRDSSGRVRSSVPLSPTTLSGADCVLVTTDHTCIPWDVVVEHARVVVDTRNATADVAGGRARIVLL
jgi:UDP-N-acetyl-D-glucosamine dehydrogenase